MILLDTFVLLMTADLAHLANALPDAFQGCYCDESRLEMIGILVDMMIGKRMNSPGTNSSLPIPSDSTKVISFLIIYAWSTLKTQSTAGVTVRPQSIPTVHSPDTQSSKRMVGARSGSDRFPRYGWRACTRTLTKLLMIENNRKHIWIILQLNPELFGPFY
jgi:hypothetical protein